MSLVIARANAGDFVILGDIALSYDDRAANPFFEGCLKQYRLSDELALAFAGDAAAFEAACPQLLSCHTAKEVLQIGLRLFDGRVPFDLLICERGQENIQFLKGGLVSEAPAGFIGDAAAYDCFQRAFSSGLQRDLEGDSQGILQIMRIPEQNKAIDNYSRLFNALEQVIADPNVPSVGGAVVPLCTDKGAFRYMCYAKSSAFYPTDGQEKHTMHFGGPELGGYSIDLSDDSGRGGSGDEVGLYFLQGGLGVFFPANASGFRRASTLAPRSPALWVYETEQRLGHGILSMYLSAVHCFLAGEDLLAQGLPEKALFCYELRKDSRELTESPEIGDRYVAGHAESLYGAGKRNEAVHLICQRLVKFPGSPICRRSLNYFLGLKGPQGEAGFS
ncbi:MAG: hypothetical protein AB7P37_12245 [Ramlibacter sp.]